MSDSVQDMHFPGENKDFKPSLPYPLHGGGQPIPETSSSQDAAPQQHTINTTHDDGHKHCGFVDASGNGETDGVHGHVHQISSGVVQSAGNHTHRLIQPSVFKRGSRAAYTNQFDDEGAGYNENEIY